MATEENTFNALRRTPFKEMVRLDFEWQIFDASFPFGPDNKSAWFKARREMFKSHHWKMREYRAECKKYNNGR